MALQPTSLVELIPKGFVRALQESSQKRVIVECEQWIINDKKEKFSTIRF